MCANMVRGATLANLNLPSISLMSMSSSERVEIKRSSIIKLIPKYYNCYFDFNIIVNSPPPGTKEIFEFERKITRKMM